MSTIVKAAAVQLSPMLYSRQDTSAFYMRAGKKHLRLADGTLIQQRRKLTPTHVEAIP